MFQNCDYSKKLAKNNNKIKQNMFYFLVKTFSDKFLDGCNSCGYFTMHFSTNISIFIMAVKKLTAIIKMLIFVEKCIVKYPQELHPPKNLSEKVFTRKKKHIVFYFLVVFC